MGFYRFHKWGELVNKSGAIFKKVGRVDQKVGRVCVGRFASGAICHRFLLSIDEHLLEKVNFTETSACNVHKK